MIAGKEEAGKEEAQTLARDTSSLFAWSWTLLVCNPRLAQALRSQCLDSVRETDAEAAWSRRLRDGSEVRTDFARTSHAEVLQTNRSLNAPRYVTLHGLLLNIDRGISM